MNANDCQMENVEVVETSANDYKKYRRLIVSYIAGLLQDDDKEAGRKIPGFVTCIKQCMNHHTNMFIAPVSSLDVNEKKVCFAFLSHIMQTFLLIQNRNSINEHHAQINWLMSSLINLIKGQDPESYDGFVGEITAVCKTLMEFCLYIEKNPGSVNVLKHFVINDELIDFMQVQENLPLQNLVISVDSIEQAEDLQINLLAVLSEVILDLSFCGTDLTVLNMWEMLNEQIEHSSLLLKSEALKTIGKMLKSNCVPKKCKPQYYLLTNLNSLTELCCSGEMHSMEGYKIFEESLADCYLQAVSKVNDFDPSAWFLFSKEFSKILGAHGFNLVKNVKLETAILELICIFVGDLKRKPVCFTFDYTFSFRNSLLQSLYRYERNSLFSKCLFSLVEFELDTVNEPNSSKAQSKMNGWHNMVNTQADFYDSLGSIPATRFSPTWEAMIQILLKTSQDCQEKLTRGVVPESGQLYEVCCIVEVGVLGLIYNPQKDQSTLEWFSRLQLCQMFSIWDKLLLLCSNRNQNELQKMYKIVIASFLPLLTVADKLNYVSESLPVLGLVVSVPLHWDEEMDNVRKFSECSHVEKISRRMFGNWDSETKKTCIIAQSLLAHPISKLHYLAQLLSANPDLRQTVIQRLSWFIHKQPDTSIPDQLLEILLSLFVSDQEVQVDVVSILGDLCCVLSKQCVVGRRSYNMHSSFDCFQLRCSEETIEVRDIRYCHVLLLKIFQHLPTCGEPVKLLVIRQLGHVFRHCKLRNDLWNCCLDFMHDSSYPVRYEFGMQVSNCIAAQKSTLEGQVIDTLLCKLRSAYSEAKMSKNVNLQQTMLLTISKLASNADDKDLLRVIVICLVENLSNHKDLSDLARRELNHVALITNLGLSGLFVKFKQPICKSMIEVMHESLMTAQDPMVILNEVSSFFEFYNVKTFLTQTIRYILPDLIRKATPQASALIRQLSQAMDIKKHKLILAYFRFVFPYLALNCSTKEIEMAMEFCEKESEFNIESILKNDFQKTHNELLLYLSSHPQEVKTGLKSLASFCEKKMNLKTDNDLTNFLNPRLLGFLAFFDAQLIPSSVAEEDKKLVLRSLIDIIKLMGPRYITPIRMKVMATLRTALNFEEDEFLDICCSAWDTFLRNVEPQVLGNIMSQVVATLLPLSHRRPAKVAAIFRFLIIENKSYVRRNLQEIYFIPEIPELREVRDVLRKNTERLGDQSLQNSLQYVMKGLTHESSEVHLDALANLKELLRSRQSEFHELINESDPIIAEMVQSLISGCRETDHEVRIRCGQCLGSLGALDPGLLEMKLCVPVGKTNVIPDLKSLEFSQELITVLIRSYLRAKDARFQDCASYGLQELLPMFGCNSDNYKDSELWNRFPENLQEILQPLLHSRYQLNEGKRNLSCPIYGSPVVTSYSNWITFWTVSLSYKVREENALRIFKSCCMAIKHDLHVAAHLLPHLVVHALLDMTPGEKQSVLDEIMAVLNSAASQDDPPKEKGQNSSSNYMDIRSMCCQTIFSLLDHLTLWCQNRFNQLKMKSNSKGPFDPKSDPGYRSIQEFLDRIPKDVLALASYRCHAYHRSLMHLEAFIRSGNDLPRHLEFLQKVFIGLEEPDGVDGVAAVRKEEPKLQERILQNESTGQLQDAMVCYESAIELEPQNLAYHTGLLRCLMDLDQQSTAMVYVNGLMGQIPDPDGVLHAHRIEAAWKLASWDDLEKYISDNTIYDDWGSGIGNLFVLAKKGNQQDYCKQIESLYLRAVTPLSAAAMERGAYQRGYEHVIKLHVLNELDRGITTFLNPEVTSYSSASTIMVPDTLLTEWSDRLKIIQSSHRYQEPVLSARRVLLSFARKFQNDMAHVFDKEISKYWIQSAKVAREGGNLQRAYGCLLHASNCKLPDLFLEKAKWHWQKGEAEQAIASLKKAIDVHYSGGVFRREESERKDYAKAKLLLAQYTEQSGNLDGTAISQMYKEAREVYSEWEDVLFATAQYLDKILNLSCANVQLTDIKSVESRCENSQGIMHYYVRSLTYGCQYVYQSMPRILDVWLDLGTIVSKYEKAVLERKRGDTRGVEIALHDKLRKCLGAIHGDPTTMDAMLKLPPFVFCTALPQLLSRICHSNSMVYSKLKEILAKVLSSYPHQSIWKMMAHYKSSNKMRAERCVEVCREAQQKNPGLGKLVADYSNFADKLLQLCNKQVETRDPISITKEVGGAIHKLLQQQDFTRILLPLQSAMTVTLPAEDAPMHNHVPFPRHLTYIQKFEDMVEIMPSLLKPKKLTLKASDGKTYMMMCKPKDDLRKDCRLMEFNALVNQFLMRDAEARRRHLHIRTYTVVPLNEECGCMEWVLNLTGLRIIMTSIYNERGLPVGSAKMKAMLPAKDAPLKDKLIAFRDKLVPAHPPVFREWFLRTFPDPTSWYFARLSYCHTTAVMSVVGYILGLGDRHGENINMDSSNGDTVHCDFNCLFNRGENFDWPERVPFRLTQNMIDAMGPLGYEGVFRKSCEVTLRLMRDQRDNLVGVLKPLIYDPLLEWSKSNRDQRPSKSSVSEEVHNDMASKNIENIEQRLKGILTSSTKTKGVSLPLSIEGQINQIIEQATSEVNLCQMYAGWAAYM